MKVDIKNLPIKKKLMNSFMVIVVISILTSFISLICLQIINDRYKDAMSNYGFSQGQVGLLGIKVEHSYSMVKEIIVVGNTSDVDRIKTIKEDIEKCNEDINLLLQNIDKENVQNDKEQELINNIKSDIESYEQVKDRIIELGMNNKTAQASQLLRGQGNPAMDLLTVDISELLSIKIEQCNLLINRLNRLRIIFVMIILATIALSVIFAMKSSKYLSDVIGNPIIKMSKIAKRICDGDLDVEIQCESNDEIGELAQSFSKMVIAIKSYISEISSILGDISNGNLNCSIEEEYKGNFIEIRKSLENIIRSLNDIFENIGQATIDVKANSEKAAEMAELLSDGSKNEKDAVRELCVSIDQINKQVNKNADNAIDTSTITNALAENIDNSNIMMDKVIKAMEDIEDCSNSITSIMNTINDIAERTNLLALNAAIEAARAGDLGSGFAVVADEVKSLASQSADAARETNNIVNESIKAVNNGKLLVYNTANTLNESLKNIKKTRELSEYITDSSKEQYESIAIVNERIKKITETINRTVEVAENSAISSEELKSQSSKLEMMINKFKHFR
ncbi:methyl-accepting chemotaxis protein [Clostridium butyricum]|uniref:methyl-accepting chemotaxis protein n=1 Tax=Clostridium butyricum TaxID=1492 RepID=UPI0005C2ABFF|nr:methyl-accepting chemotaxis protein [Clostridium butyricum]KIU06642.1 methyl-accepting chemotaxis sensory transducer [Clostridium butyricum]MBA8966479.1 methyl-accepting chemotaxis protein [Clostridium butyricum]MBA8972457.1 methyl-accepting chemotaxis protein [Clostridium butyricum]MBC2429341.1 HAMP domain-containing protein [Clostridium butyricum]MDB2159192.1 methyl-accepting chemotaxis protein [Clostridium butyricum]